MYTSKFGMINCKMLYIPFSNISTLKKQHLLARVFNTACPVEPYLTVTLAIQPLCN